MEIHNDILARKCIASIVWCCAFCFYCLASSEIEMHVRTRTNVHTCTNVHTRIDVHTHTNVHTRTNVHIFLSSLIRNTLVHAFEN